MKTTSGFGVALTVPAADRSSVGESIAATVAAPKRPSIERAAFRISGVDGYPTRRRLPGSSPRLWNCSSV
eukprot:3641316-Prymnesium_polylepis.1